MLSKDYIDELPLRIQSIVRENLIGLYLIGSVSLEDYIDDKSDLDVFGIILSPLSPADKNLLAQILDNKNFPCPAKGLDIVLMTKDSVFDPKPESDYDFWYATGATWPTESWSTGKSSEMIVFLELCRQNGLKIFGIDSTKLIGKIDEKLILQAFKEILEWHKGKILDNYHDLEGQNSVLNACRIYYYLETKKFYSKTEGGYLFLQSNPDFIAVQKAINIRVYNGSNVITEKEILEVIQKCEKYLAKKLSKDIR